MNYIISSWKKKKVLWNIFFILNKKKFIEAFILRIKTSHRTLHLWGEVEKKTTFFLLFIKQTWQ
jgi:hypothetical protein